MNNVVDQNNATARAIEDLSKSADFAKLAIQLLFAAHGGAALAMLSFLTTIATTTTLNQKVDINAIYSGFAYAASLYISGLVLSIMSIACNSLSKQRFGWQWGVIAYEGRSDLARKRDYSGRRWSVAAYALFSSSLIAFIIGSAFAISSLI